MTDLLKNNHLSGSMLYDIAMPYFHDAAQLAPDGLFLNLYDYDEQIRFEADYWDNRCAEDVSVAGQAVFHDRRPFAADLRLHALPDLQ